MTERTMALGSSGLIVYTVDDSAVRVRIVNIIWLIPNSAKAYKCP